MKVLNLYSGLGGNRRLWSDDLEVTAVEYDAKIAAVYQDLYPDDTVIVTDAHQYLLDHYEEFDIIWSSPPCQSHSSFRKNICCNFRGTKPVYPDMKLYQEILLLDNYFKGRWVVENVKPFYEAMIEPRVFMNRHMFWSNCNIGTVVLNKANLRAAQIPQLQEYHDINLSEYDLKGLNKRQLLRNMVDRNLGKFVMEEVLRD